MQWTQKFAQSLRQLCGATLQKVSSLSGLPGVVVRTYHNQNRQRLDVLLSAKIGDSGLIPLTPDFILPPMDKKPHGFVEIMRKYFNRRTLCETYLTVTPVCVVLRFSPVPDHWEEARTLQNGPDGIILDLGHKPPRLAVVRHFGQVPERYQNEVELADRLALGLFFESWYEWSLEGAKTKRRLFLNKPLIAFCPYEPESATEVAEETVPLVHLAPTPKVQKAQTVQTVWDLLPTSVRRLTKTRVQFYQRGLIRRRQDLPSLHEIHNLQARAQAFKDHLYLWPAGSLVWYVPPQVVEEFQLSPIYTLKPGEKPSHVLNRWYEDIENLQTRHKELTLRIHETEKQLERLQHILDQIQEEVQNQGLLLKNSQAFAKLCHLLGVSPEESLRGKVPESTHKKLAQKDRPPYTEYKTSQGATIRVARSAKDGDAMVRMMPGHHMWIHVLTGEGAHVWLEKPKQRTLEVQEIREAALLALHFSKQGRQSKEGEVYVALRADIEKKKHLPDGKVLVRRSETLFVRYDDDDLKGVISTQGVLK